MSRHRPSRTHVLLGLVIVLLATIPVIIPLVVTKSGPEAPVGVEWLHEIKLDGYRLLCRVERGKAKLLTRRQLVVVRVETHVGHGLWRLRLQRVLRS